MTRGVARDLTDAARRGALRGLACRGLCLSVVMLAPGAWGQAPAAASTVAAVKATLEGPACRPDRAVFDGEGFVEGVGFVKLSRHYAAYLDCVNGAIRAWNGLGDEVRAAAEHAAVREALEAAVAWAEGLNAVYPERKAAWEAAQRRAIGGVDEACRLFREAALSAEDAATMARLGRLSDGAEDEVASAADASTLRGAARRVGRVCAQPRMQGLEAVACAAEASEGARAGATGEPDDGDDGDDGEHTIGSWCELAGSADLLVADAARSWARRVIAEAAEAEAPVEDLERREGWLPWKGPVTWKTHLRFDRSRVPGLGAEVAALLEAAGVDVDREPGIWGPAQENRERLRAEVERLAEGWGLPERAGKSYADRLAKGAIKDWHAKVKVKKAWLSSPWRVRQGALGTPISRTATGYVLFKVKGEPWCQLRPYTVTEARDDGKFRRAREVAIGFVRFQPCR